MFVWLLVVGCSGFVGVSPGRLASARESVAESLLEGLSSLFEPDQETLRRQPKWLSKVRGVARYADRVAAIEALGPAMGAMSDEELRAKTKEFRGRVVDGGESLDSVLTEAFAVCREASKRTLGLYHYDVQLAGGIVLHEGKLAEMATGEGKTLVATLPLYLRAIAGDGAHLVTVNDYLARRDVETLGPLYSFLGLSVGVVEGNSDTTQRRRAYGCDITYASNNELGFDYLRDNLCTDAEELTVTRRGTLPFAIVDEADSILIDEARTPLIISAEGEEDAGQKFLVATEVAKYLQAGRDYEVDAKGRRVTLTDAGYQTACRLLNVEDLFDRKTKWAVYLNPALNAKELYLRERDYIVAEDSLTGDPQVVIVDEFTGRVMEGRRWNGGLHQAVEAKEGVKVRKEQVTAASITYQSLFLLYDTLSGMTGTAKTEAKEFKETYELEVVTVPTAKPLRRVDQPDLVYPSKLTKFRSALREIRRLHERGQPVLVGTTTVEDSALISELLENEEVPHRVLNAKPEVARREAEIIAQAGRRGAVTIATNMAGRGTDILLGGNAGLVAKLYGRRVLAELVDERLVPLVEVAESLFPTEVSAEAASALAAAAEKAASKIRLQVYAEARERAALAAAQRRLEAVAPSNSTTTMPPPELPASVVLSRVDEYVASATNQKTGEFATAVANVERDFAVVVEAEREQVRELGGLVVLGTERHESRRIDLQLRGRSGRQGDSGESVFAISLEDKMFNVFGADKMSQLRLAFDFAGDDEEPLSSDLLTKSLSSIQEKVENFYKDIRSNLFKYDKIIDAQRRVFYLRRSGVLRADRGELIELLTQYARDTARDVLANTTAWAASQPDALLDVAAAATIQLQRMFPQAASAIDLEIASLLDKDEDVESAAAAGKNVRMEDFEATLARGAARGVEAQIAAIDAKAQNDADLASAVMRFMILREFDRGWKDHLRELDLLRETVGFQAFSQKDPYQEWTIQSNEAFKQLSAAIYRYSAITFLSLDPEVALVQRTPDQQLQQPSLPDAGGVDVVDSASSSLDRLPPRRQDLINNANNNNNNAAAPAAAAAAAGTNRAARRAQKGRKKKAAAKSRRRA
ncbi:hypothetical protein CTAYLR_002397 [Chrysophaeum taylorii]|uniref:Protein translocase subunit SecA n=1 Tax=Chrysophaeum taylorii TaxID=2483200 RepID=A0AAD7XK14_9STRA|nr:hypothetical protein CTAYLR_002397 [Chrysophaeum taylorii]